MAEIEEIEKIETRYIVTDLDLVSKEAFPRLQAELAASCELRSCDLGGDGRTYANIQERCPFGDREPSDEEYAAFEARGAVEEIESMLAAIRALSKEARAEWDACCKRDFNLGFECGDTWSFMHSLPPELLRAIGDVQASVTVTMYPMRDPQGRPRG